MKSPIDASIEHGLSSEPCLRKVDSESFGNIAELPRIVRRQLSKPSNSSLDSAEIRWHRA